MVGLVGSGLNTFIGDLEVALVVRLLRGQSAGVDVHLHGLEEQAGRLEGLVARVAHRDVLLSGGLVAKLDVLGALLGNRALVGDLTTAGLVVVSDEDPRLVRQRVEPVVDRAIEVVGASGGEVAPPGAHVGHEEGILR